jgi:hypothetical protein
MVAGDRLAIRPSIKIERINPIAAFQVSSGRASACPVDEKIAAPGRYVPSTVTRRGRTCLTHCG